MPTVVRDDDVRDGQPRIDGSRITVLDVKRRVIDNDEDPHVVAGEYDVSLADLFRALAYYYEHRDAFAEAERRAAERRASGETRTEDLLDGVAGTDRTSEQAN